MTCQRWDYRGIDFAPLGTELYNDPKRIQHSTHSVNSANPVQSVNSAHSACDTDGGTRSRSVSMIRPISLLMSDPIECIRWNRSNFES